MKSLYWFTGAVIIAVSSQTVAAQESTTLQPELAVLSLEFSDFTQAEKERFTAAFYD